MKMIDGIIIVNKEKNMTSRNVVDSLCHIFNTKKVGHTGTLDPMATGVLVCCLNKATKLGNHLISIDKEYKASMQLGIKTDTYDITGKVIAKKEVKVTNNNIIDALNYFNKTYTQEVPIYSSVKVKGKKLYHYARNNEEVILPKKEVTINNIELIDIKDNIVTFKCHVSKGTYIRSLINDIGEYLGCYATMTELERTKQGIYSINESYTLDDIKNNNYKIITIDDLYNKYPKRILLDTEIKYVRNGNPLPKTSNDKYIRMYDKDELIAIYILDNKEIKPFIMLV